MGSGTTALAAMNLGRNSVGYEINHDFRRYYHEKMTEGDRESIFEFFEDNNTMLVEQRLSALPYRFVDVHKFESKVDIKKKSFGSKFEITESEREKNEAFLKSKIYEKDATVMVNHARPELYKKMIETGICYLRAGDSKGSLLVTPGFERLAYVLLHTNGKNAQLFQLKTKAHFQIWTRETLQQCGFEPRSAAYYVVLHFEPAKPITLKHCPNLKEYKNTFRAKIRPLSDFMGTK